MKTGDIEYGRKAVKKAGSGGQKWGGTVSKTGRSREDNIKLKFLIPLIIILTLLVILFYVSIIAPVTEGDLLHQTCQPIGPSSTHCTLSGESEDITIALTVDEAIEAGFPVNLPLSEQISAMGLSAPEISLKTYDSACSYLEMLFRKDDSHEPSIIVQISDGCALLTRSNYYSGPIIYSESVKDGKIYTGKTTPEANLVNLLFQEPERGFWYAVSSSISQSSTIKFIESFGYVQDK